MSEGRGVAGDETVTLAVGSTPIPVVSILGVGRIPKDRTSASRWLAQNGVPVRVAEGDGRKPEFVDLTDLPEPERLAYLRRQLEDQHLDPGNYDDEAHAAFMKAAPARRQRALRKAEIAALLVTLGSDVPWPERLRLVHERFGTDGASKPRLKAVLTAVKGVDPINFAPALLDGHKGNATRAAISDEAWSFFMTTLRDAGPDFPLKQAWRDVRDLAGRRAWDWPEYTTVWRHWSALPNAQKLVARHGREAAIKALTMPIMRDKTTLRPLEIVSLDGRMQDFWVDFGDGKAVRPIMIALIDVASNYVLGFELVRSENAVATSRLIRSVSREHGIPDKVYTDNGSAFAGHLVAGGADFKRRGKGRDKPGLKPLGVCYHLGIGLTFAIPKNAQAKIAERTFAVLSRGIDDRPEFRGAHAVHAPGATPTSDVAPVPVAVADALCRREIDRHNREEGRRSAGARGRSYEAVFREGLAERVVRKPTAAQLYLAGLVYKPASVDRWGRVQVDTWTYGDIASQAALLPWHKKGQILIGRDPDSFDAPAVAFDDRGELICDGILPVKQGVYDSVEGAKEASKMRKAQRAAVDQAEAANGYVADAEFAAALDDLGTQEPDTPAEPAKVVGGRFGSPLQPKRKACPASEPRERTSIPSEMLENFDRKLGIDWSRYGG